MSFLTAAWQNLILVNYSIDPDILSPFIPKGTTLDMYNNTCYISLVGFMFKDTRVLGIKCPGHIHFEEVNLRFYVKRNDKRGVVFIKEIVPKPLITCIANTIYKEHYQTCKMWHHWADYSASKHASYAWKMGRLWQSVAVETEKEPLPILPNTEAHFITEHFFGYTKHNGTTFEYEVEHPTWQHYAIKEAAIDVDFEHNYGSAFSVLNKQKPLSVILAKGSPIKVHKKKQIE